MRHEKCQDLKRLLLELDLYPLFAQFDDEFLGDDNTDNSN